MEEVILVDEQDAVIGYKLRDELTLGDRWRICGAVIFDEAGKTLIAQRSAHKKHDPLHWGPGVADTLSKGETYEQCVVRECEEELGIVDALVEKIYEAPIDAPNGNKRYVTWFVVTVPVGFVPTLQTEEVADYAWVGIDELVRDIKTHPEKYLNSSKDWLHILNIMKDRF